MALYQKGHLHQQLGVCTESTFAPKPQKKRPAPKVGHKKDGRIVHPPRSSTISEPLLDEALQQLEPHLVLRALRSGAFHHTMACPRHKICKTAERHASC